MRPAVGRFLQRDPLGYHDSPSLYSYVGGSPTNNIDPMGLHSDPLDESSMYLQYMKLRLASYLTGSFGEDLRKEMDELIDKVLDELNPTDQEYLDTLKEMGGNGYHLALQTAVDALQATSRYLDGSEASNQNFGVPNALRHCIWACLTKKRQDRVTPSEGKAFFAGLVCTHELGEEGTIDSEADKINNRKGEEIAESGDPCAEACKKKLDDGELVITPPPLPK